MFSKGDKVTKITDGSVGEVISSMKTPSGTKYQVKKSDGEIVYISEENLELYQEINTPIEAFQNFQFNGIDDYKRVMSFQRLNGGLTNMFYSMSNTLTEYLPHQFLPVTKFLQSPEERILIADEVGLGKTVEAMYIWKELEARRNAKRLLVVCPAALREKWKRDMSNLFGIHAEIVKADKLLETFKLIEQNRNREQFAYICSMESIRSKKTDQSEINIHDKLGKLNIAFEEFASNYTDYAFDLTIIDEAHYMRNRETANFKTGARLRDISEALILLSATPIQTGSDNLFSILNLLSPERFDNQWAFEHMLQKDGIYVKLANCLQRPSSTPEEFESIVESEMLFCDDELIQEIQNDEEEIFASTEKRMQYAEELREQVFYNNLFNRTRRRFVFTNTAKRRAFPVPFKLTSKENYIYERVTQLVKEMAKGRPEIITFALIARQRQMASCMPAAFKDWNNKYKEQIDTYTDEDDDDTVEIENENEEENVSKKKVHEDLKPFFEKIALECQDIRYEDLKLHDSKFAKFLVSIKEILKQNPKEKIIVFSFFRSTNEYLKERLEEEGISAVAIKGGMGQLKDDLLEEFRTNDSINILISSEVGSEGLDLQFASVEYNYDLPWNPMRLEQRIGRIDRIGQKADVLRIYNLYCPDTIEDEILQKLYDRVKIFENSIGDMEDIVGQPIQELTLDILNPNLSEHDIREKAELKIQALENQRLMNNRLEEESGVLDEYRDMVLSSIDIAKTNKRCIDESERVFVIKDFLLNYFPGSKFFQDKSNPSYYYLTLSNDAIISFRDFRHFEHLQKLTSIDTSGRESVLLFSQDKSEKKRWNVEVVDLDHPIFDWIKWVIKKNPIRASGCSAITMQPNELIQKGNYIYYIQKWVKKGIEKSTELKYFLGNVDTGELLPRDISENVMNTALSEGKSLIDPMIRFKDFEPFYNSAKQVVYSAFDEFEKYKENYKRKSNTVYKKQVEFVTFTAEKKIKTLEETIEKLRLENRKPGVIHMNEKHIYKVKSELDIKLKQLEKDQYNEPDLSEVAIGVLVVE